MEVAREGPEGRTSWLTTPGEVDAHLVFLATQVRRVAVSVAGRVLHGEALPPLASRLLPLRLDPAFASLVLPPRPRTPLRLDYTDGRVSYAFHTRCMGVDEQGDWLLLPPRAVERSDRRLVHRHKVYGDPAFRLRLRGRWEPPGFRPFVLYDISTDGVGFLYDPLGTPVERNDILSAKLEVGREIRLSMLLRVAHVRPFPGARRLAGARYLDLGLEERMELGRSLARWLLAREAGRLGS